MKAQLIKTNVSATSFILHPSSLLLARVAGLTASLVLFLCCAGATFADRVHLKDGTTIEADEAWDDPQGVWYRQGGVSYLVEHARVKSIEHAGVRSDDDARTAKPTQGAKIVGAKLAPDDAAKPSPATSSTSSSMLSSSSSKTSSSQASSSSSSSGAAGTDAPSVATVQPFTIYLKDGASFEVDEVAQTDEGAWYKRGNLSIFIARERIERIERARPAEEAGVDAAQAAVRRGRRWSTGSARLDGLIRQNGARFGVDPYLIFLVMEQESHFNARAVSSTGARGLMQLMPGTAARFGVRNAHDPAQNIAGGTRLLKQLLGRFNNRVDLVLASYNAGEGNVVKFGYRVPPFRETRSYVRKISSRYGSLAHAPVTGEEKNGVDDAAAKHATDLNEKRPRE